MKKLLGTYLPDFKNSADKTLWLIVGIVVLGLLFLTAGYFSGKALYYFTH
ncbi:hypothetical protein [Salinimicrobium terrae]|nr:hypothetical protein [Salinimicrobium terrae]